MLIILYGCCLTDIPGKAGGGGGGVTQQSFKHWRLYPEIRPLFCLRTILDRKGTPFIYLLFTNGTHFTSLVQIFASLLTAVNALFVMYEYLTKAERSLDFFTAVRCICWPFWALFTRKSQISLPFHILQLMKSGPLCILKALKRYPFQVEPSHIDYYRKYHDHIILNKKKTVKDNS